MKLKRYLSSKELFLLVIGILLTICAIVLFAGNTYNPDYQNYVNGYLGGRISIEDGLINSIIRVIFLRMGFSYQVYLSFCAVGSILMIWSAINYYSDGNSLAFLLYMIYPFLLDIVQLDNCLSYVIVLFSLRYLDDENEKLGARKYAFGIMIASLFHPIAIVYLVFLLKYIKSKRTLNISVLSIMLGLVVFSNVVIRFVQYIPYLSKFSDQISIYINLAIDYGINLNRIMLLYLCILLFVYVICRYKYNILVSVSQNEKCDDTLIKVFFITLALVPLLSISAECVRVIRNLWILYYCFLCKDKYHSKKYFLLFAIVLSVFLFYKDLGPNSNYFERVTKTVLENNMFWK